MTPTQMFILAALVLYALYRQSIRHEVHGASRFKLASIYAIVGLAAGGLHPPPSAASWGILAISVAASLLIGILRGRWCRVWREPDGRLYSRGTPLTIGLFLLLVGSKWIVGAYQYMHHQPGEHGGFGEVLILIAVMAAVQAEIVWRRTRRLSSAPHSPMMPPAPSA